MIVVDMPPSYLRNADLVGVESLLEGTVAHRAKRCPNIRRQVRVITVVQAMSWLHAQWCPKCTGRHG